MVVLPVAPRVHGAHGGVLLVGGNHVGDVVHGEILQEAEDRHVQQERRELSQQPCDHEGDISQPALLLPSPPPCLALVVRLRVLNKLEHQRRQHVEEKQSRAHAQSGGDSALHDGGLYEGLEAQASHDGPCDGDHGLGGNEREAVGVGDDERLHEELQRDRPRDRPQVWPWTSQHKVADQARDDAGSESEAAEAEQELVRSRVVRHPVGAGDEKRLFLGLRLVRLRVFDDRILPHGLLDHPVELPPAALRQLHGSIERFVVLHSHYPAVHLVLEDHVALERSLQLLKDHLPGVIPLHDDVFRLQLPVHPIDALEQQRGTLLKPVCLLHQILRFFQYSLVLAVHQAVLLAP
mmetsp:Transcript_47398/g.148264  ORF Transcript_47398/g.148264 Transcript_47398/m.148264 type:complete len:350 (+) Transcript_47398:3189-4238(+)